MIVYISGPMQGLPDHNYPMFYSVQDALEADGYTVLNPARNFDGDTTRQVCEYMREDIAAVLKAHGLVLLPEWETSEGAKVEVAVARSLDLLFFKAEPSEYGWSFPKFEPGDDGCIRTFGTGATRDTEVGKLDFEGFLSPLVLDEFARYMDKHRTRSNGTLRDSDDWQKGIPVNVYMKSMWRHFMDVWREHREPIDGDVQLEALMALLFNVQGYAFEILREM